MIRDCQYEEITPKQLESVLLVRTLGIENYEPEIENDKQPQRNLLEAQRKSRNPLFTIDLFSNYITGLFYVDWSIQQLEAGFPQAYTASRLGWIFYPKPEDLKDKVNSFEPFTVDPDGIDFKTNQKRYLPAGIRRYYWDQQYTFEKKQR